MQSLVARLEQLRPGDLSTVIGLDFGGLRSAVATDPTASRRLLALDFGGVASASQAVAQILDDLADLALALWPAWSGQAAAVRPSDLLALWRRGAERLAATGRAPRFRRVPPRVELAQLLTAIDPSGLILCAELDARPPIAAAQITALEWCAGAGASIVILCPTRPASTPPFDRILYGAFEVARPTPPVLERLVVPEGKPHGGSDTEKRVQAALLRDPELAPLFTYNRRVETGAPGFAPCVDLLWLEGRVVVELDGLEHQGNSNYGNDRHRDYELLLAGYLVLRLTNRQVATDLQLAIEKIRRVVHYRRSERSRP